MMKKTVLFCFMLLPLTGWSQVLKFKAFQTNVHKHSEPTDSIKWSDVNILIVINIDKAKIDTYGSKRGDYDVLEETSNTINDKGDQVLVYKAVDEDGLACAIDVVKFKDTTKKNVATMIVRYEQYDIAYRLEKDE